jgi:hypothetical protein
VETFDETIDNVRRTLDFQGRPMRVVDDPACEIERRGNAMDGRAKTHALDGSAAPDS